MGAAKTVRAAAVQLRPELYSREGTIERAVAKIDELATQGVQIATFIKISCRLRVILGRNDEKA